MLNRVHISQATELQNYEPQLNESSIGTAKDRRFEQEHIGLFAKEQLSIRVLIL